MLWTIKEDLPILGSPRRHLPGAEKAGEWYVRMLVPLPASMKIGDELPCHVQGKITKS